MKENKRNAGGPIIRWGVQNLKKLNWAFKIGRAHGL